MQLRPAIMNKFQLLMDLKAKKGPQYKIYSIEEFILDLTPEEQAQVQNAERDVLNVLKYLEEQFNIR